MRRFVRLSARKKKPVSLPDFTFPGNLLDNFNRADGALGANYEAGPDTAVSMPTIASNAVTATTFRTALRIEDDLGQRQGAFLTSVSSMPGNSGVVFYLWVTNPGASRSFIQVELYQNSANTKTEIYLSQTSGGTDLGYLIEAFDPGYRFVNGDTFGATVTPEGLIQVWMLKSGDLDYREVCSAYATITPPATSQIGFGLYGSSSVSFDNLHGGELSVTDHDLYFGGWISNTPPSFTNQDAFDTQAGKDASIYAWGTGLSTAFSGTNASTIRNAGYIPFWHIDTGTRTVVDIAAGTYDSDFQTRAAEVAAWGHPLFARFFNEFNGNWYTWGNQDPEDFIAAWQRVIDLFRNEGADNVTWVWASAYDPTEFLAADLRDYYPGDDYVDWHAVNTYRKNLDPFSFTQSLAETYDRHLEVGPDKPLMLTEVGTVEQSTGTAAMTKEVWIEAMFHSLSLRFPAVRALLWYDVDEGTDETDYTIASSAGATSAWQAGIAAARFKSNIYASLATTPIPRPV